MNEHPRTFTSSIFIAILSLAITQQVHAAQPIEKKLALLLENRQYDELDSTMERLENAYKSNFLAEEEAERAFAAFSPPQPVSRRIL